MRSVLLVLDELPVLNTTGHTTYNNAFVAALVAAGLNVTLLITGNRFVKPVFSVEKEIGISGVDCFVPSAIRLKGNLFIAKPVGLAKWLLRRPLVSRIRRSSGDPAAVPVGSWLAPDAAAKVAANLDGRRFDCLLVDAIFRHEIIKHLPKAICSVLIGHDVFHQRCAAMAAAGLKPVPFVTREQEIAALSGFNGLVAITAEEAAIYESLVPACPVIALPSPIDARVNAATERNALHVLYVASRGQINVDGISWFLDCVWPKVRKRHPGAVLDVVGSIGPQLRRADPGMVIHGRVDDFSFIAAQAMCAINPIRAGSGLKIKMLDYFSYGLGCVTTPAGAAGFPPDAESPIAVASDETGFASMLSTWLADPALCRLQSERAIKYVRQFSPESFASRLTQWMNSLVGKNK